jgi:hypothetical protein
MRRRTTRAPPGALSPTLACLEASLEALAGAAEQLGIHAADQVSDGGASPVDATVARAEAGSASGASLMRSNPPASRPRTRTPR